jgi:tRNA(Arg) A34 adenosine deaminase TadA
MDKSNYIKRAIDLAVENVEKGGGPFGAVIVMNGEIVAEGVNRVTANNDPTAHAEVNAIRTACKKLNTFNLQGCELYTSCEPCPMCLGAIYWSHISHVYYGCNKNDAADAGFDDSFIYKELALDPQKRSLPSDVLMADEAKKAFDAWKSKGDKINY